MANTVVAFGDSGLWKTTNAGFAAKYTYEATGGKVTRYISADGGGYRPIQPLVDAGIVEPFRIVEVKNPLVVMRKLSIGYWPDRLVDGRWVGEKLLPADARHLEPGGRHHHRHHHFRLRPVPGGPARQAARHRPGHRRQVRGRGRKVWRLAAQPLWICPTRSAGAHPQLRRVAGEPCHLPGPRSEGRGGGLPYADPRPGAGRHRRDGQGPEGGGRLHSLRGLRRRGRDPRPADQDQDQAHPHAGTGILHVASRTRASPAFCTSASRGYPPR